MIDPSHEKSRPGEKATSSKMSSADSTKSSVTHRRYWAQQLLDAGKSWPLYGSPEWCALPLEDPRRVAACVAAAEIYTRDWYDNLEERLNLEIDQARIAFKHEEDAEYARSAAEHRARVERSGQTTLATSFQQRRAAQLATARPADFPGRGAGA